MLAESLLDAVILPDGSAVLAVTPTALANPPHSPAVPGLIDEARLWSVPGSPDGALAFERGHLPPSAPKSGQSGFFRGGPGGDGEFIGAADPRPVPGVESAELLFTVTADGRGGADLRVDAQIVWLPGRSPGEQVTVADHSVIVTRITQPGGAARTVTVTDPSAVVALGNLFNGLHTNDGGVRFCPGANPPTYTLAFAPTPGAHPDLIASGPACASWQVSVAGGQAEALFDPDAPEALITGLF